MQACRSLPWRNRRLGIPNETAELRARYNFRRAVHMHDDEAVLVCRTGRVVWITARVSAGGFVFVGHQRTFAAGAVPVHAALKQQHGGRVDTGGAPAAERLVEGERGAFVRVLRA